LVKVGRHHIPLSFPERQLSVLMVGNFLSEATGIRGVCEDLAEQFKARGWHVIITSTIRGRLARIYDMLKTAWSERSRYSIAQVDVYSGPAFFWAEAVCLVLRIVRKPYILTLHGGNLPFFAGRWPGRVKCLLKSAVAVTSPSPYLLQNLSPYRNDMIMIPNPLDIRAYEFKLRRQVRPKLVWLRAFHSVYNPSLAPKALALLAKDYEDSNLTMAGPDKADGSLHEAQEVVERLGVADRITICGKVAKSDVPTWINRGDIFLNTSNVDNAPVSVLEAMACGLCVVSTNVGGIPYLLEHEKDALLVPPDDPEAMACAVRRIVSEPGLAEGLSFNARRKGEQFDWSRVMPLWETLLASVAGSWTKRPRSS
jgi:glycosyltransferase involved in cell wall biosynthesis